MRLVWLATGLESQDDLQYEFKFKLKLKSEGNRVPVKVAVAAWVSVSGPLQKKPPIESFECG